MDNSLRQTTLCFLIKEHEILLAMKKRGFSMGKWNGYGGKPEPGENITQTAVREMQEEIGVSADIDDLEHVMTMMCYFKERPEWDQEVHAFLVRRWQGDPIETEEMKPAWFSFDSIPYQDMWPDDKLWLPRVLAGEKLDGEFHFNADGSSFDSYTLKNV